jgi:MFS transporter, VNT family, synaptic vesicle glycoprotein 2
MKLFFFSISGIAANTYAYLGEFCAEKYRARYLSFAGVFMAFALTFCPGVGWLILKFQHVATISFVIPIIEMNYSIWRIFLLLCSLLSGVVSILLFFLPESPKFLLAQEKHDEALNILKDIYRRNKNTDSAYPVDKIWLDEFLVKKQTKRPSFFRQVWIQTSPLFKSPLLSNTLRTSFIMFSLFAASSGFFMWTPDILNKLLDYRDQNYTVCHVIDDVLKHKRM